MTASARNAPLDAFAASTLVLLCLIFGLNQVAMKVGGTGISPVLQAGLRSIGGFLLVYAWARGRGIPFLVRDGTLGLGTIIGLLFALEFICLYWGLTYTTAARAVVFLYLAPFVVAAGSHLFVPGDQLTRSKVIGLACAFLGLVIGFSEGIVQGDRETLFGDFLCVLAALFWGATTVTIKATKLSSIEPTRTLLYQHAVTALVLPPLSLAIREPGIFDPRPEVFGWLAFQIVVVSSFSYLLWFWILTRYSAVRMSAFSFLAPLFGVFFGWLILSEPIGLSLLAALALVAAGIWLVNSKAGDERP